MTDLTQVQLSGRANEIAQLSSLVKAKAILDPAARIVIEGVVKAQTWWVAADEIVFKAGSQLIFPQNVTDNSREVYIVAERITIENPLQPALVSWEKLPASAAPDRGQAVTGGDGSGDGASGGRGAE